MKRILTFVSFAVAGIGLFGCPIYGDDANSSRACRTTADCPNDQVCDSSGRCVTGGSTCTQQSDCPSGAVCASDGNCRQGDCITNGCVSGYICKLQNGQATCVASGNDGGSGDSSVPMTECMTDSTCVPTKGAGAKCLNGTCVAAGDQCTDTTQCNNGYQCVQGVCTPGCSAQKPCPTGYTCDLNKGVCTGNPNPCSNTSMCTNSTVCVQGHCVDPCNGSSCAMGLVCVGGGCIPDQKPQFVCATEGQQDACKTGSICLHHNCYIACDMDASMPCKNADQFNMCKSVTTGTGTYSVCGSSTNLGSECDLTQNKTCSNMSLICIDGYCK